MRSVLVRMMALVMAAALAAGSAGPAVRAADTAGAAVQVREEGMDRAGKAVFTVLGLAFLCAGGMVALIVAKDPT